MTARTLGKATPDTVDELVRLIADSGTHPLDPDHVAATLELNGWTDGRAAKLGYADVFDLAATVHEAVVVQSRGENALPEDEPRTWLQVVLHTIRLYLRGLSFAAPMILSSASVLGLRYSLWSYVDFDTEVATAIALGTFASFMVAGGFTQAIARRGLFYISQEQHRLARLASLRLTMAGVVTLLASGVLILLFVLLFPILPWRMVLIGALYFVPMTLIWLGVCLLYMLHREPTILSLIGFGIILVYVLFEWVRLPMMVAQTISMCVVAAGAAITAVAVFISLERANPKESEQHHRMRWSQTTRSLAPFFLYGISYFALAFADRLMAWSRPNEFHPYFVWFLGDYELGLDWALWTLILPMGIVEIYIDGLFRRLSRRARSTTLDQVDSLRRLFKREHLRTSALVLVTGFVSIFLILAVILWLDGLGYHEVSPLNNARTRFVFFLAAPAFSMITVGLQSVLVLFSLNEPWMAARASAQALAGNLIVGFLASRLLTYWWAVLGLVVGAILFAVLTTRAALKVLNQLDYYMLRST